MLGYHPAFALKSSKPSVETEHGETFTLVQVLATGSRALEVTTALLFHCMTIVL